jgi:hypothetical protein
MNEMSTHARWPTRSLFVLPTTELYVRARHYTQRLILIAMMGDELAKIRYNKHVNFFTDIYTACKKYRYRYIIIRLFLYRATQHCTV